MKALGYFRLAMGLLILAVAEPSTASVLSPVSSGLVVALDGSDATTEGGSVSSWNDQAALGGANHALQTNPGYRPELIAGGLNGHNVVRFSGVHDFLDIGATAALNGDEFTWFIVASAGSIAPNSAQGLLISAYDSGAGPLSFRSWGTFHDSTGVTASYARTDSSGFVGQSNPTAAGFATITATWAGDDSVSQAVDGMGGTAAPTDTGANASLTGHQHTRIGAQSGTTETRFFNGDIAELLIYDRALSGAERDAVEDYLDDKYFATSPEFAAPEPSTLVLFGLGGLLLVGCRVRRRG